MAERGLKPTPTAILKLRGTYRADRRPDNEPTPEPGIPDPPDLLAGEALIEWDRTTCELNKIGILSHLDLAAVSAYCQAWVRWLAAEKNLAKTGPVVKASSGYPILNPSLTISNKALQQVRRLACELGLTPSARTRISLDLKAGEPTALDKLLARTGTRPSDRPTGD